MVSCSDLISKSNVQKMRVSGKISLAVFIYFDHIQELLNMYCNHVQYLNGIVE